MEFSPFTNNAIKGMFSDLFVVVVVVVSLE